VKEDLQNEAENSLVDVRGETTAGKIVATIFSQNCQYQYCDNTKLTKNHQYLGVMIPLRHLSCITHDARGIFDTKQYQLVPTLFEICGTSYPYQGTLKGGSIIVQLTSGLTCLN
jgi:hypothetical protein